MRVVVALIAALGMIAAACGSGSDDAGSSDTTAAPTTETTEAMAEDDGEADDVMDDEVSASDASFVSTQFNTVEEGAKFNAILAGEGIEVLLSDDGPMIDQVLAGAGVDVVGTLHGNFPPLARENALANMIDVLDDLSADREIAPAFVRVGTARHR